MFQFYQSFSKKTRGKVEIWVGGGEKKMLFGKKKSTFSFKNWCWEWEQKKDRSIVSLHCENQAALGPSGRALSILSPLQAGEHRGGQGDGGKDQTDDGKKQDTYLLHVSFSPSLMFFGPLLETDFPS